jgi:hypothetical protein
MKRLLLVSYDFPPSSIGIWRTLKFCRYMTEFGWQPSILTVKPVRNPRMDWKPLDELPPGTEVRRTGSLDANRLAYLAVSLRTGSGMQKPAPGASSAPSTNATGRRVMDILRAWVLTPDDRMGWLPFAVAGGWNWLRKERFDAIYSTCYPHTAHVAGAFLANQFRLPYVADFRDIWIGSYVFYHPPTSFHDRLQRRLESYVISSAGAVLAATEPIRKDFLDRYPEQSAGKFHTLTNGFDSEDFAALGEQPPSDHFTITYAGTLFNSTSPKAFFEAIRNLLAEKPRYAEVLRLRFLGSMIEPYQAMVRDFGLSGITSIEGYVAHDLALRAMAEADALLLIVSPRPGSHIMLTQKVFEYVAARRPVLGLVPDGAAKQFLTEIGEGPIIHPDDAVGIHDALGGMLTEWEQRGRKSLPENPVLGRFHRRSLTGQFCGILDQVARGKG